MDLLPETKLPHAQCTAPLSVDAKWLDNYEQKLAGLAELTALVLQEWTLVGRQLPSETEFLLQALEQFQHDFCIGNGNHDQLLQVFCSWKSAAQPLSDPNFAQRPLALLLSDCGEPVEIPETLTSEMLELRRLPIANLVADQQEIRFYNAMASLGRDMSWLRLSDPRPFLKLVQIADPTIVAAALAALTLESPQFALAASKAEALSPGVGCWALAELLRSIFLSMLPIQAIANPMDFETAKSTLAQVALDFGENVWGAFGEQALLRYGAYDWLLNVLRQDQVQPCRPLVLDKDRFVTSQTQASNDPLTRSLLLLLNAAQQGTALRAAQNRLQQAISTLSVQRMDQVADLEARQRALNRAWCDLVPLE